MIHEIDIGSIDVWKLLPKVLGGGVSNTNGRPLILFIDDGTVLKFTAHYRGDYDLALERRGEKPKQWQGVNSAIITHEIAKAVPGETGFASDLGSIIIEGNAKGILADLDLALLGKKDGEGTVDFMQHGLIINNPERFFFIGQYFSDLVNDINGGRCYDELVVSRMPEYHGFLSNLYALPQTLGMYDIILKAALFEVAFYYFKVKKYLPSFKHNDLHMENVMIFPEARLDHIPYRRFVFGDDEYYVPYFGYSLRIIDLGLSALPEKGINSVLDNSMIVSNTVERGEETKFLVRFVSLNPTAAAGILGDEEERNKYISDGFRLTDNLFKLFRSKGRKDMRADEVIATIVA